MSGEVKPPMEPAWSPGGAARRKIDQTDIEFAQSKRPAWGWQTIANIRGVNAADLRCAVEALDATEHSAKPSRTKRAPVLVLPERREVETRLRPGSAKARALLAIAAGAKSQREIAEKAGVPIGSAGFYATALRRMGFLRYATSTGWPLTKEGYVEVAALNAAAAAEGRGHG